MNLRGKCPATCHLLEKPTIATSMCLSNKDNCEAGVFCPVSHSKMPSPTSLKQAHPVELEEPEGPRGGVGSQGPFSLIFVQEMTLRRVPILDASCVITLNIADAP